MIDFNHNSDQSFTWSEYGTAYRCLSSPKTQTPPPAPAGRWLPLASWFTHRNLQALRQSDLQMPNGQRTRPQVLSLHQLPRLQAHHDLCSQGTQRSSTDLPGQPPEYEIDHGTDLRNKPRTACATGAVLDVFFNRHNPRYQRRRHYCRRYGMGLLGCRAQQGDQSS